MSIVELVAESLRNMGYRTLLLWVLTCGLCFVVTANEIVGIHGAIEQERDFASSGGYVWELQPSEGESMDAGDCHALRDYDGVQTAGGTLRDQRAEAYVSRSSGVPLPVTRLTPRTLEVWRTHPSSRPAPVLTVGQDLRDLGLVSVGERVVHVSSGRAVGVISGLVDPLVPSQLLQSKVLLLDAPVGAVNVCWIRMRPDAVELGPDIAAAAMGSTLFEARRYNRLQSFTPLPLDIYHRDPARSLWVVAVALLTLAGVGLTRSRRADIALYRALGCSRLEVLVMAQIETAVASLIASGFGIGAAVVVQTTAHGVTLTGEDLLIAIRPALSVLLLSAVTLSTITLLFTAGRIHHHMQD